jgi:hypothetical protein
MNVVDDGNSFDQGQTLSLEQGIDEGEKAAAAWVEGHESGKMRGR